MEVSNPPFYPHFSALQIGVLRGFYKFMDQYALIACDIYYYVLSPIIRGRGIVGQAAHAYHSPPLTTNSPAPVTDDPHPPATNDLPVATTGGHR